MSKKHQQALRKIMQALEAQGAVTDDIKNSFEVLLKAVEQLPEPEKSQAGGQLPAPLELKEHSKGLALFTDGACRGNPGPGAWACVAQTANGDTVFEACGHEILTTNNKMEIQAVIGAFQQLENYCMQNPLTRHDPVLLYTDSKYVVDGLNSWVAGWKARGWKKADGKAPENMELWQTLDEYHQRFNFVQVRWVKGHSGHPQNDFCDQLANRLLNDEGF